jgi:ribosomal protein S18 acetylase RimI-like enzyme
MVTEIAITRGGAERIDDVEPLWHAMHRHHRSVAAHLTAVAPFRSDDESWIRRRAFYERLMARPGSFFLLAEREGSFVGYAAVGVSGTEATLEVGDRVGELESLVVLPEDRGNGLGGRLMDAVFEELRRLGAEEITIAVREGNDDAARFYERRGLVPYLRLTIGRVPPAP